MCTVRLGRAGVAAAGAGGGGRAGRRAVAGRPAGRGHRAAVRVLRQVDDRSAAAGVLLPERLPPRLRDTDALLLLLLLLLL